jgi:hypothetical protein
LALPILRLLVGAAGFIMDASMIYFRRREKVFILNEEYGHEIRNRYDDE